MELLIVLGILTSLFLFFIGAGIWFWIGLLAAACIIEIRAYRVKCKSCGDKMIAGRKMKFCNQCGKQQSTQKGWRLRCESCHRLTRSELNMLHCNHCGQSS